MRCTERERGEGGGGNGWEVGASLAPYLSHAFQGVVGHS